VDAGESGIVVEGGIKVTCIRSGNCIMCIRPIFRLRTFTGAYVYMDYHEYLGVEFYYDRNTNRKISEWWRREDILRALEWFLGRNKRA